MSDRQRLFSPEVLLDDLADDLRAMASERVVILDEGRVSFFHQAFFDYAFARRFIARSGGALEFLLSGEQHLFRRTQVRAVLELQRDQDFDASVANLSAVLTNNGVRYHVRRSVFDMLTSVSSPTPEEWAILNGELERAFEAESVWRLLGTPGWFRVADAAGAVERWFASGDDSVVDRAVQLATVVQRSGHEDPSDRGAAILRQYLGASDAWANRLRYVAMLCEIAASRGYFDLFLLLLSGGLLDATRGPIAVSSDFWSIPYSLPKRHPEWAAQLIGTYLRRRSQVADAAGVLNPFAGNAPVIPDSQATGAIFRETAEGDPLALATEIIPWIIETASKNRITRDDREIDSDHVWGLQFYGWGHSFEGQLFAAAELALQRVSAGNPQAALDFNASCSRRI